jgi:dipeptide transport system ATP-binding protein
LNDRPTGCLFHPRCRYVRDACLSARPKLDRVDKSDVRCIAPLEVVTS